MKRILLKSLKGLIDYLVAVVMGVAIATFCPFTINNYQGEVLLLLVTFGIIKFIIFICEKNSGTRQ